MKISPFEDINKVPPALRLLARNRSWFRYEWPKYPDDHHTFFFRTLDGKDDWELWIYGDLNNPHKSKFDMTCMACLVRGVPDVHLSAMDLKDFLPEGGDIHCVRDQAYGFLNMLWEVYSEFDRQNRKYSASKNWDTAMLPTIIDEDGNISIPPGTLEEASAKVHSIIEDMKRGFHKFIEVINDDMNEFFGIKDS